MRNFHIKILLFLFISAVTLSCRSDKHVKSDKISQRIIFQQYHISYDAENENLVATASFTENNPTGTPVLLTKKSTVSFNGEALEQTTEDGNICYQLAEKKEKIGSLMFEYTNNDGDSFKNKGILSSISLKSKSLTISKKSGVTIPFSGPDFTDDETLICTFFRNDKSITSFSMAIPSGKYITISSGLIQQLSKGNYTCQFTRTISSSDIKAMDRGGLAEGEFVSKKINVTITD